LQFVLEVVDFAAQTVNVGGFGVTHGNIMT
jgi:hypothetical protein